LKRSLYPSETAGKEGPHCEMHNNQKIAVFNAFRSLGCYILLKLLAKKTPG